jgi:hypothetical protein
VAPLRTAPSGQPLGTSTALRRALRFRRGNGHRRCHSLHDPSQSFFVQSFVTTTLDALAAHRFSSRLRFFASQRTRPGVRPA